MTLIQQRRPCKVALILAVGLLGSTAVLAAESTVERQVTIRAERPTTKVIEHTSRGVPIQKYEISYLVTFADLDIGTPLGADALKARVYMAADALCKDLDKLYPLAEPDSTCVRKAQDGAMSQVNTAISMAQAESKAKAK